MDIDGNEIGTIQHHPAPSLAPQAYSYPQGPGNNFVFFI